MSLDFARALIATLPAGRPGLFNPWTDTCDFDDLRNPEAGPDGRLRRLAAHLDREPRFVLVGEAPGYRGCRYSGVAFSSERQLLAGLIPGIAPLQGRLTSRATSFVEGSATVVWRTLYRLKIEQQVVNWNALQMHPHKPGKPHSNRPPTSAELALGREALLLLKDRYPAAQFVAVGRNAAKLMAASGIVADATIRHPSMGGASEFSEGLAALV